MAMRELRLKIKFSTKIFLSLLFVLLASLLGAAAAAWIVAGDVATTRAERALDQALQYSEFDFEQEEADLSTLGKWLVNQDEFITLVRARDSIGLVRMLEPLTLTGIIDVLAVSDPVGEVIVRVRENKPITQGDNILGQVGISEALSGKTVDGLEPDEFGELRERLTLPIYGDLSQRPIGALVIGFYFDEPFFQRISNGVANDAVIVFGERIVSTNLPQPKDESWIGQTAAEEVVLAERERRPSGIVMLKSGATRYLFKFRPLHFPATVPAGMYGLGISSDMIELERVELFRELSGWILLIGIGLGVVAILIARALNAPIRKLHISARGIVDGKRSESNDRAGMDELGDIAMELDTLRERLRAASEPAPAEIKELVCGEITLDSKSHRVMLGQEPVTLSATEFKLLHYLMINRDTVVSASQIIANVWGYSADEDDDVVRMAVSRLRRKIERAPSHPKALVTVPGAGYMLKSRS